LVFKYFAVAFERASARASDEACVPDVNPAIETVDPRFNPTANLSRFRFECADSVLDAFAK
jgi:hypothetical protein